MRLTEILPEKANVLLSPERLLLEVPQGLYHSMAIFMLITWYVTSGATLFSNKYILSHFNGDAFSLGTSSVCFSYNNIDFAFCLLQERINLLYQLLADLFNYIFGIKLLIHYLRMLHLWKLYFVIWPILVHFDVWQLF